MKTGLALGAVLLLGVSGCSRPADTTAAGSAHGRYAGVGLYAAGPMWSQVLAGAKRGDAGAAKLADDEEVIVAIDQATGEIRQCGALSGVCVAMNPWAQALPAGAEAPVALSKHADQVGAAKGGAARP